jgi:hypothetical protein
MARSRAAMEMGRSTSKVRFIWGKTVRPRRARTGMFQLLSSMGGFLSWKKDRGKGTASLPSAL